MKLTLFTVASTAALALAAPAEIVQKRADYCDQWGSAVSGQYTIYNNLWGQADATSGSQCTGVDGLSGTTLKWHTKWTWAGGAGHVKSYANVVTKISQVPISSLKTLPSSWTYTYTGTSIVANVAYDLFFSSTASGSPQYELMIWLAALGGAGPISSSGSPVATVTLAGSSWKLYKGVNGQMTVYSFVAASQVKSFKGDLVNFISYLTANQGLSKSQVLQSVGAGTEPFSGTGAVLTTTAYSLTQS